MANPYAQGGNITRPSTISSHEIFHRRQLALQQIMILSLHKELSRDQATNLTKMIMSEDTENLVVAEEAIKNMMI